MRPRSRRTPTLENGKPVYDGFLVKTPGGVGRIRRCAPAVPRGDARQTIHDVGVPVIEVVAQGEIGPEYQRPDSDQPNDRFRIYEVAGAAHIDMWAYRELPIMAGSVGGYGRARPGDARVAVQRQMRSGDSPAGASAVEVHFRWRVRRIWNSGPVKGLRLRKPSGSP